jgi:hypothetical protein
MPIILKRQSEQIKVEQLHNRSMMRVLKRFKLNPSKSSKEALSLAEEGFRQEDIDVAHGAMKWQSSA